MKDSKKPEHEPFSIYEVYSLKNETAYRKEKYHNPSDINMYFNALSLDFNLNSYTNQVSKLLIQEKISTLSGIILDMPNPVKASDFTSNPADRNKYALAIDFLNKAGETMSYALNNKSSNIDRVIDRNYFDRVGMPTHRPDYSLFMGVITQDPYYPLFELQRSIYWQQNRNLEDDVSNVISTINPVDLKSFPFIAKAVVETSGKLISDYKGELARIAKLHTPLVSR